jgi:hypothetical protein
MNAQTSTVKGGRGTVYVCANARNHPGDENPCRGHAVHEDELLGMAVGWMVLEILDKRAEFEADLKRRLTESARADPSRLAAARKELAALERKIANGNEVLLEAPAHRRAALNRTLDQWEGARDNLLKDIEALERSAEQTRDVKATTRAVSAALDGLQAALFTGDTAVRRRIFKRVYEWIKVIWMGPPPAKRGQRPEVDFRIKIRDDAFTVGTLTGELAALFGLSIPKPRVTSR